MSPCGYRGEPRRQGNCTPLQIEKYVGKFSGPLPLPVANLAHVALAPIPLSGQPVAARAWPTFAMTNETAARTQTTTTAAMVSN